MAVPMALLKDWLTDSLMAHDLASMMGAGKGWCLVGLMVHCSAYQSAHRMVHH